MMLGRPLTHMPATTSISTQYQSMEGYQPTTVFAPATTTTPFDQQQQQQPRMRRKRKADVQDAHNERLAKRMSLLNIEQNGTRLYVPVEQPQLQRQPPPEPSLAASDAAAPPIVEDEPMQLDDTKHKVYIYNLDDELSSDNESEPEQGRLAFLPDIEKHLRANRIPMLKPVLPNKDGELAGMQLVLYSDGPSSITVPEEQDSVRKAVLEARARVRQRQAEQRREADTARPTKMSFATPVRFTPPAQPSSSAAPAKDAMISDYDADAMDID